MQLARRLDRRRGNFRKAMTRETAILSMTLALCQHGQVLDAARIRWPEQVYRAARKVGKKIKYSTKTKKIIVL